MKDQQSERMNVHQLELFYHVVRHQGVSPAARALGREQPTLSRQVIDLEQSLHVKLYHRRPFKLTEKGELLYRRIEPFFRELPRLEELVRGGDILRIGASPIVLTHHLPAVEREVRKTVPNLHLLLREANQPQLVQWLERGEIDLAITLLPRDLPPKMFTQPLLELPLSLLVPKSSQYSSADELLTGCAGRLPGLICLPPDEMVCREFQQWLQNKGVEWRPRIEVGSLHLVEHYVQEGYGVGLSVQVPGIRLSPKLCALPLPQCPPIPLGMLWRDHTDRLLRAFRSEVERRADKLQKTCG